MTIKLPDQRDEHLYEVLENAIKRAKLLEQADIGSAAFSEISYQHKLVAWTLQLLDEHHKPAS